MTAPVSPSTPASPSHRKRRSLRLSSASTTTPQDFTSPSPYTSATTSFSRRSSRTSQTSFQLQSPVTPRPMSSRSSRKSFTGRKTSRTGSINSIGSGIVLDHTASADGLGNLADELGAVWDDDGRGDSLLDELREGDIAVQSPSEMNDLHDFGYGVLHSPLPQDEPALQPMISTSLQPPRRQQSHKRTDSAYDGSDYGPDPDSDEDSEDIPPLLRKRMREIEKLSRDAQNPADAVSEGGGVIKRTAAALRDLGPPQSNIEYGITRMVTAYTSMATHRTHKQREIFTQSHSLLYGNSAMMLPDELLDIILEDINTLYKSLPFLSAQNPLLSLQILMSQTNELTQTLRSLTDLLQENKLAANAATRKLKSVREMVADMKEEEELVENSIMLIQAQDWDRRLRQRDTAKMCREVVGGFAERWGLDMPPEIEATA